MNSWDSQLAAITPRTVEVYLEANGWTGVKRESGFYSTWRGPGRAGSRTIFVPLSKEPADYIERIEDVVQALAHTEARDPASVAADLRHAGSDLVRVRLESPRVGFGELPLDDGKRLFDGVHDMMLAAACAAVEPRANFGSKKSATAKNYLDGVRLGQTEPGSYVVTVISEVAPSDQSSLVPEESAHIEVPFERQVTSTLVESLNAARDSAWEVVREHAEVSNAFEEVISLGVSANLCDAVALIGSERAASSVEVSVNWAASRPPTTKHPSTVKFEPSVVPVLAEAAQSLKKHGPFEGVLVEGFVEKLERGREAESGTVVISGKADGVARNVHVELDSDAYREAIRAHDDRLPVEVRGTLMKQGRHWLLLDAGPLRVGSAE